MRVAAVELNSWEIDGVTCEQELAGIIDRRMSAAVSEGVELIVLPGYTGCLFDLLKHSGIGFKPNEIDLRQLAATADPHEYLDEMCSLSAKYGMTVCPGTYWVKEDGVTLGASCVIRNGEIIFQQKQLYLARWERELGLGRGKTLELLQYESWKLAIVQSADVFYPQVSRMAALMGAQIVLSPVGFTGEENKALQLSGMWQEVQQNLFFCAESAYDGKLAGRNLWGQTVIHAPLEMTQGKDGLLAGSISWAGGFSADTGDAADCRGYVSAELDNDKRVAAISRFDVLSQLNPGFYDKMGMFGGRK